MHTKKEKGTRKMEKNGKTKISFNMDLLQSASSMECTGLIPRPPANENENNSYHEIFDFGPPDIKKKTK